MSNSLVFALERRVKLVDAFSTFGNHLLSRQSGKLSLDDAVYEIEGEEVIGGYLDYEGLISVTTTARMHFRLVSDSSEFLTASHLRGLMNLSIESGIRLHRLEDGRYSAYSLVEKEIVKTYALWFKNVYPSAISRECLFFYMHPKPVIESHSLVRGDKVWVKNIGEHGNVGHLIGLWQDQLLLWLNDNQLLCLDARSGQLTWLAPNLNETFQRNGIYQGIHLLAEENKVVVFYGNSYFEFDLTSQQVNLVKDFGPWGTGWVFATSTVSGQYIYFTGRDYATGYMGAGAFDRQQLSVVWFYAPPEWQGQVPKDYEGSAIVLNVPPQVTDTHLYVLENGINTLHIFKREQNG